MPQDPNLDEEKVIDGIWMRRIRHVENTNVTVGNLHDALVGFGEELESLRGVISNEKILEIYSRFIEARDDVLPYWVSEYEWGKLFDRDKEERARDVLGIFKDHGYLSQEKLNEVERDCVGRSWVLSIAKKCLQLTDSEHIRR